MIAPAGPVSRQRAVTGFDECERLDPTRSIPTAASDPIFEQMTLIDACGEVGITLQVQHLAVAIR
jgi:hypothetical protein